MAGESAPVVDAEWSTARLIAHAAGSRVPARVEQLVLAAAAGRTLAHDLVARSNLPGFSSSAMDGWAIAGDGPWLLGSAITAGTVGVASTLRPRTGRPIATGAMIPPGTRAILRCEHGVVSPTPAGPVLSVAAHVSPGQPVDGAHIRLEGEEARIGERLVPSGSVLTPARLALAAAGGNDEVAVRARPRVRIVVLGDEIIGAGVAMPGLVRDAFGPQLPSTLESLGLRPESVRHVGDDPARTAAALDEGAGELVVVTGGSSRGTTDHARSALLACGGRILVDGVSMRPGHPVMLGVLGDGRLVLCLPGNPAAGMLALLSIGLPMIDGLLGRPLTALGSEIAGEAVAGAAHGVRLVAATVHDGVATACEKQSAAMLIGLANADTVLVVPPAGMAAGERVTALRPPWA
ncbi:molybdopterin molybdotransferase MoeA [Conyzicola sp.]|uniref:molybdopterin molybdotransferase MoeA n=1 Tax=Conyzicola sp. TaxID=1969404 RepID=UPI00398993F4